MLEPIRITSLDDPRVADYRDVRDADLRGGGGHNPGGPDAPSNKRFIAESETVIRRLLQSGRYPIRSLFLSDERLDLLQEAMRGSADLLAHTILFTADEPLMRDIAGYRHHHGALAIGVRPSQRGIDVRTRFQRLQDANRFTLIVVEGVTNVDNIGAIFRNAAAFGADGVILDGPCADPLFRKSIRVSMGQVFNVEWAVAEPLHEGLRFVRQSLQAELIAAEICEMARPLPDFTFPQRCAIIVGSERRGISDETMQLVQHAVQIPMARDETSLNVAMATAVFLFERARQQGTGKVT